MIKSLKEVVEKEVVEIVVLIFIFCELVSLFVVYPKIIVPAILFNILIVFYFDL